LPSLLLCSIRPIAFLLLAQADAKIDGRLFSFSVKYPYSFNRVFFPFFCATSDFFSPLAVVVSPTSFSRSANSSTSLLSSPRNVFFFTPAFIAAPPLRDRPPELNTRRGSLFWLTSGVPDPSFSPPPLFIYKNAQIIESPIFLFLQFFLSSIRKFYSSCWPLDMCSISGLLSPCLSDSFTPYVSSMKRDAIASLLSAIFFL